MSLARIKIKRDTAADYTASNIVLLLGEFAYETDTFTLSGGVRHYKFKIGDGSTAWNDLPYARLSAVGGGGGASAFIDLTDVPGAYTGGAGKYVKVTETEDGLEFEVIEAADLPAGIDASKIADGSVSNAEFQRLANVTSDIQTQIDGKQPLDSDLTAIAGLTPSNDDSIWRVAGAWVNRTVAQAKSILNYVKGDIGLGNVDNTSDANKPVSTATQTALDLKENLANKATTFGTVNDTLYPTVEAVAEYVATAVSGLLDDRGNYDASVNTFPASGGSGTAGAVLKGDIWTVSVAGTLGGSDVEIGDLVRALTDTPGQTASNWAITQNNITYVPENQANKENSTLDTSTTKYPTNRLAKEYADSKVADAINNGTTTIAPSQNAVFDALALKADDSAVVHDTGDETIAGIKTFSSDPIIPDEVYGAGWNGSLEPPTKNAVYDKIETIGGSSDFSALTNIIYTDYIIIGSDTSFGIGFANQSSGTGAQVLYPNSEEGYNGIITLDSGTTTTGRGAFYHAKGASTISIRDAALTMWMRLRLNTAVSDGTDTYVIKNGLFQNPDSTDANGIYLYYDKDINGGNWTVRLRRASTTELDLDTGVAASSTFVAFRITVAKSDQTVTVYNESGTQLATGTPSARIASGQLFFMGECIKKSAGTTSRTYSSDLYYLKIDRT